MDIRTDRIFVARQPILDSGSNVIAYELLFRDSDEASVANLPDPSIATARVAIDSVLSMGISTLLGPHLGFINVDLELLASEAIQALPPDRFVLEILETVPPWAIDRCIELREMGFRLALDDYVPGDERRNLLKSADYVKVDLTLTDPDDLPHLASALHAQGTCLLAEKVESHQEFERCAHLGFELFQGYYFAKPATLAGKKTAVAEQGLINAFRALSTNRPVAELEELFKREASLGVQLLRIANSAALGAAQRISSFEHAIMYVGSAQLRRWILLMLYAGGGDTRVAGPAVEVAVIRGRMLELLVPMAAAGKSDEATRECAFLAGMLSLGEAIMKRDRSELVDELGVAAEIASAITDREGLLGDLLRVCEALEKGRFDEVASLLDGLGLVPDHLIHAQREAYSWFRELSPEEERRFGEAGPRGSVTR